jgi:CysZ protein
MEKKAETFFKLFRRGVESYLDALKFIRDNRLWVYFVPPLILSGLIIWGGYTVEENLKNYEFGNPSTMNGLMLEMVHMLWLNSLVLMAYKLRKYIVFVVLSPLLTQLSMLVEKKLTGNNYPFDWAQFRRDIIRAIRIALGNFVIEYLLVALWFVLALIIPYMNYATPVFLFCLGCYFYGFGMLDYVNERRRLNITESVKFVREHSGLAIGNGAVFSAMFIIPYDIGVIFAPVLAIVAATIAMHETVDLSKIEHAVRHEG